MIHDILTRLQTPDALIVEGHSGHAVLWWQAPCRPIYLNVVKFALAKSHLFKAIGQAYLYLVMNSTFKSKRQAPRECGKTTSIVQEVMEIH